MAETVTSIFYLMMFKILDFLFVFFGSIERIERAQVFTFPGFGINFSGVDTVLA